MTLFFACVATSVHLNFVAVCAEKCAPVSGWSAWELFAVIVLLSVGGLFVASRLLSGGKSRSPFRDDFDADRVRRTKR